VYKRQDEMRALMIADSKKFAGVVDKDGKPLSNITGVSDGIKGDGFKLGGTRIDLDLLCGPGNQRCKTNTDGSLALNEKGQIQFDAKDANNKPISLAEFLATDAGKEMRGLTGGVQGYAGTLFGTPYGKGSWQDKLIESFAGTHDVIGGKLTGLYDDQGNATRGRDSFTRNAQDAWSATGAVALSSPFAAAQGLPPEIWNAISILLKAAK
jgi:filamentous hemagglutinin